MKFKITVMETVCYTVELEADSKQQASEAALALHLENETYFEGVIERNITPVAVISVTDAAIEGMQFQPSAEDQIG